MIFYDRVQIIIILRKVFMRWKVGNYCFDDKSNELKNTQHSMLLEPKSAAMLHYFVQNVDKDISRDELMQPIWPNQIVSENAINRVIVQLRKALNDCEKVKRYIVTVPKVGYRFIAECKHFDENLMTPADILETNNAISLNKKAKSIFLAISLAIVVCLFFAYQYHQTDISTPNHYQNNLRPLALLLFLKSHNFSPHDW